MEAIDESGKKLKFYYKGNCDRHKGKLATSICPLEWKFFFLFLVKLKDSISGLRFYFLDWIWQCIEDYVIKMLNYMTLNMPFKIIIFNVAYAITLSFSPNRQTCSGATALHWHDIICKRVGRVQLLKWWVGLGGGLSFLKCIDLTHPVSIYILSSSYT